MIGNIVTRIMHYVHVKLCQTPESRMTTTANHPSISDLTTSALARDSTDAVCIKTPPPIFMDKYVLFGALGLGGNGQVYSAGRIGDKEATLAIKVGLVQFEAGKPPSHDSLQVFSTLNQLQARTSMITSINEGSI